MSLATVENENETRDVWALNVGTVCQQSKCRKVKVIVRDIKNG